MSAEHMIQNLIVERSYKQWLKQMCSSQRLNGELPGIGLYYGLFEAAEEAVAYSKLISFIHEKDDRFDCGMIGIRTIFRVFGTHGDAEFAYKMITRTDVLSYGIHIERFGLASLAEAFSDEYNSYNMSYNHHFMGDISGFFISHIAGIQVNPHGDDHICVNIAPTFISQLDHASAFYDTDKGRVSVSWKRDWDKILLQTSKPNGVYGDVIILDGYILCTKSGEWDTWAIGRSEYELDNADCTVVVKA